MRLTSIPQNKTLLSSFLLVALIFLADWLTPVTLALWGFYIAPILFVYMWGKPRHIVLVVTVCSLFVLLGIWPGRETANLQIVLSNRVLGIIALWILAYFLYTHKTTSQTLGVNLTKYAVLFDTAPVGISIIDEEGRIVETNFHSEQILGMSRKEHQRRTHHEESWEILRPDGSLMPPSEYASVRALREHRHVGPVEMGVLRSDGSTAWLSTTAAPLPLPGYGVVAIYADITPLRQAQQALQASEERLRFALDAISDGVWDWNVQTGELYFSERWLQKFGYTAGEAVLHISFWEQMIHPEDVPHVQKALQEHFAGRTPYYECENRLRTKSGEYRYNLDRGRVVQWDEQGRPLRMVGADTDITERKQQEAAVARLAAIVESSDDAIMSNDLGRTIASWNQAAAHLYGYAAGQVIGQPVSMLCPPGGQEEMAALLLHVQDGQVVRQYETQHVTCTGKLMDVSLTISPVQSRDGTITGTSIIARDITQQKALERAVLQLNAELEQRVQERTAELAAALEELRQADQLKEAFLAAISHELRTPLTGVLGVAEALEMQVSGPLNNRQLEHVRLLRRSGSRLLDMINSILHYTNLLAGQTPVRPQMCVLANIGMAAVRKVQAQANLKLLTVEFDVDPPDLTIEGDADALIQLLYNLLDNAVKFTPSGGSLGLQIGKCADGEHVTLAVWDTGIGIAGAQHERIFEAFMQADGGLARRYEGIGLGLAYARRMANLLGGTVAVESSPGRGSRFVVRLPLQFAGERVHI